MCMTVRQLALKAKRSQIWERTVWRSTRILGAVNCPCMVDTWLTFKRRYYFGATAVAPSLSVLLYLDGRFAVKESPRLHLAVYSPTYVWFKFGVISLPITWGQPEGRTDLEGCCWWGRGVIQTTGTCEHGCIGSQSLLQSDRVLVELQETHGNDMDFCYLVTYSKLGCMRVLHVRCLAQATLESSLPQVSHA